MTFSHFGHTLLKYMLVIPLFVAFFLGMVVDGAIRLAALEAKDTSRFEIRVHTQSIKELSEQEI